MRTLKGKRVDKGFTQEQMANILGISTKTYNRKELGIANFTINETLKISQKLEMDLYDYNNIFLGNELPNG